MGQSLVHGIESRIYQEMLFAESVGQNSLIVLPTGLGKTIVMLYLVGYYLNLSKERKILVVTPTKPLVHQITETFKKHLDYDPDFILEIDGSVNPEKRAKLYLDGKVIISTPQTLANDFLADRLHPKDFHLLCFDEAHRATGNYAYVKIIQLFESEQHFPRVVAFTATPGNNKEQILQVLKNLQIKAVLSRFEDDPDVRPFVSQHKPHVMWVDLPKEYRDSLQIIEKVEKDLIKEIEARGLTVGKYLSKTLAMVLQNQTLALMREYPEKGDLLNFTPNLIRVLHLRELIETQGLPQASISLTKWFTDPQKKTLRDFLENPFIKELHRIIAQNPLPHPKLLTLINLLQEKTKNNDSKVIIFSNFRDTIDFLIGELTKANIICKKFIGQSSDKKRSTGMSQKEQLAVLEEFKNGNLNILLSTSVGEEGLDVGSCDLVVFYDSVPSIVRSVQRTGRGRKRRSEVIRLVTRGTKDAAMYYATLKREKQIIDFIRRELPKIFRSEVSITEAKKIRERLRLNDNSLTKFLSEDVNQPNQNNNLYQTSQTPAIDESLIEYEQNNVDEEINFANMNDNENSDIDVDDKESIAEDKVDFIDQMDNKTADTVYQTTPMDKTVQQKEITDMNLAISEPQLHSSPTGFYIIVDPRERFSNVPRLLKKAGIGISLMNIPVGDYKISNECVIERKTAEDFAKSIIDGRLFEQASNKLVLYKKPVILLEGMLRDVTVNISLPALQGAMASLILDFRIPIIQVKDENESAEIILAITKREQQDKKSYSRLDGSSTKRYPINEIQRFALGAIPGISRVKADLLLDRFGSIKNISNAEIDNLLEIEGIGKTLTDRIYKFFHHDFHEEGELE